MTRTVALAMQVSLDGYVRGPGGDMGWMHRRMDATLLEALLGELRRTDTHVMGRVNYEAQAATWPDAPGEIAAQVNRAEKVVFSRTLRRVDWPGARLATRDLAAEIAHLRARPGGRITITGGAGLNHQAIRLGLVDEYHLVIHPVVLGGGLPLWPADIPPLDLHLVAHERFATGAVRAEYRPQRPISPGGGSSTPSQGRTSP
jgi:dihydrofolate reductase